MSVTGGVGRQPVPGDGQADDLKANQQAHGGISERMRQPACAEDAPAVGQAAAWLADVEHVITAPSAVAVAKQLARLAGEDSQVTIPLRSLADAVGQRDSKRRLRAFTESGIDVLVRRGWIAKETVGRGRGARTTFFLLPRPVRGGEGTLDRDASEVWTPPQPTDMDRMPEWARESPPH